MWAIQARHAGRVPRTPSVRRACFRTPHTQGTELGLCRRCKPRRSMSLRADVVPQPQAWRHGRVAPRKEYGVSSKVARERGAQILNGGLSRNARRALVHTALVAAMEAAHASLCHAHTTSLRALLLSQRGGGPWRGACGDPALTPIHYMHVPWAEHLLPVQPGLCVPSGQPPSPMPMLQTCMPTWPPAPAGRRGTGLPSTQRRRRPGGVHLAAGLTPRRACLIWPAGCPVIMQACTCKAGSTKPLFASGTNRAPGLPFAHTTEKRPATNVQP